jgi:hypothetical protein
VRVLDRCLQAFRDRPWPHLRPPPALVSVHRLATGNLGDRLSSPALYFDFLHAAARHDLLRVPQRVVRHARVMLVGGGGLVDNAFFRDGWRRLIEGTGADLIAWGVGHNRHGSQTASYPDFLRRFTLVGVRDAGPDVPPSFDRVPCASCMHAEFDRPHAVSTDVVCYSHASHPIDIDGLPRLTNIEEDFATVVRFLASAETVLTNTYHGMYWATLLGRKVVVFPYSSKFYGFPYPVALASTDDWKAARRRASALPEALGECRAANLRFADKVRARLATLGV